MNSEYTEAVVCPECGEQMMWLAEVDGVRCGQCRECHREVSMQVYREARLEQMLPPREDWPQESGVCWSGNLPDCGSEEGAVLLVIGPREWASLSSRAAITFREAVEVEVRKGRSAGVLFSHDDGSVGSVQVDLPGEVVKKLHQTGHWGASVGPRLAPLHLRVVVQADA